MNEQRLDALAEYLTDVKLAAHYSICLAMPDTGLSAFHVAAARKFFALRDRFGVVGYDPKEEILERWRTQTSASG